MELLPLGLLCGLNASFGCDCGRGRIVASVGKHPMLVSSLPHSCPKTGNITVQMCKPSEGRHHSGVGIRRYMPLQ